MPGNTVPLRSLLDPTLNQRKDFAEFLKLLADCNPGRQFAYFGELRLSGINAGIAELLAAANFTEVEIGLQSVDPVAQELMDRKNNMAFEPRREGHGDAGISVKVDLIIGLPGDTVASIRRGMRYLARQWSVRSGPGLQPRDSAGNGISPGSRATRVKVPTRSAVLRAADSDAGNLRLL